MRSAVVVALIAVVTLAAAPVAAESLFDKVNQLEIFTIKSSSMGCPLPFVGPRCPEHNFLFYHTCCSQLKHNTDILPNDCCFRLQDWVVATFILLLVLTIAGIVINLLRCMFCAR
ncbi:hypothetical protein QR680_010915 [Steinernema hermaphroditum]|uniref:Uncharacterized protein n=1 Tax=Steinernema hermaphroditum TaxID=289476 RepID=A0AA39MCG8_9BILA|nr:hypothetical protein QR680_010915 [Steinernema hermaphroditum]